MGRTVTETHTTGVRGDSGPEVAQLVASRLLDVPDFPKPGVVFKDLMPLVADGEAFRAVIDGIIAYHGPDSFDTVAGIEARGFVLAAAVAYATGVGVVPVRAVDGHAVDADAQVIRHVHAVYRDVPHDPV